MIGTVIFVTGVICFAGRSPLLGALCFFIALLVVIL